MIVTDCECPRNVSLTTSICTLEVTVDSDDVEVLMSSGLLDLVT